MDESSSPARLPALDGIRGMAILLVLLHNAGGFEEQTRLLRTMDTLTGLGWIGVQLFFVLSGFLITGNLLDSQGAPRAFRSFYMRRLLRIFPLYYLVLFLYFIVLPSIFHLPALDRDRPAQVWYWTYLANWSELFGHDALGIPHFWSLALEEQFYLVWPPLALLLGRRAFAGVCIGLAVASLLARVGMRLGGLPPMWAYQSTPARIDAMALGALAALALRSPAWAPRVHRHLHPLSLCAAALFLGTVAATRGLPRLGLWVQTLGYSVVAVCSTVLVLFGAAARPALPIEAGRPWARTALAVLCWRPLCWLGFYSYAVYVAHQPINLGLRRLLGDQLDTGSAARQIGLHVLHLTVVFALSCGAALLSWRLVEGRFWALKDRFTPGTPPAPPE